MSTVLILEDSREMQMILKKILSGLGASVSIAETAQSAREALAKSIPDLILLDINLPDTDGFQFCSEIQSDENTRTIPFIFISGNNDVTTKVTAFSLGAEDFIVKPFNVMELRARLEARLKKILIQKESGASIQCGDLRIDSSKQRAWNIHDEQAFSLTPREFKILLHLAQNEDAVLSRDQLLDAIWGNESKVFDRTIDTHISAIRKKLGPLANYIESVTGSGYRFTAAGKKSTAA